MRHTVKTGKVIFISLRIALLSACASVGAQQIASSGGETPCRPDALAVKPTESGLITTEAGKAFQVLGQDFIDHTSWRAGDPLLVCEGQRQPGDTSRLYTLRNVVKREELVTQLVPSTTPEYRPTKASEARK